MIRDALWLSTRLPYQVTHVRSTWKDVAHGCSLTKTRKATFRDKTIIVPPRLGIPRLHRYGFRVWLSLHDGQTPDTIAHAAYQLQHSWRAYGVRIEDEKPGKVLLSITFRDPLTKVEIPDTSNDLLHPVVGRLETGHLFSIDFKKVPHWLITGATQSGKSNFMNALISALAPQPVALIGFDLKGGMEFTPYKPRLSVLATTRDQVLTVLDDVLTMLFARMDTCTRYEASNIWELDPELQPIPLVLLIDEVAELFLTADPIGDKEALIQTANHLTRVAQLGRALGIYLVVSGQRVGSDLGKGVTALRAQLSGRICFRVNDSETAKMTLGDLSPDAVDAAQRIRPSTPGIAITATDSGLWQRARSIPMTSTNAKAIARQYAYVAPGWEQLLSKPHQGRPPLSVAAAA